MGSGFEGIAENLNITASTAHRVYSLFERTGSIDRAPSKEKVELRQLNERTELYIIGMIFESPKVYLGELCREIM